MGAGMTTQRITIRVEGINPLCDALMFVAEAERHLRANQSGAKDHYREWSTGEKCRIRETPAGHLIAVVWR
jgi:hypothetical protein